MKENLFLENINHDDKETATGRLTPRLQPAKRDQAQAATTHARSSNRFGFRQNVVRPMSGITPKLNEFDNVNNNSTLDTEKRRSKSATAPTRNVAFAQPSVKTVNEEFQSHTNAK